MKTKLLLLALLIAGPAAALAAPAEGSLDSIFDVDFRFFMQNPRLPWGKDAFRKRPGYVLVPLAEEKLELQGIARSESGSTAIINGEVVNVGSMVGARRVVEIGPHYVVLEKDASLMELTLNPNPVPATRAPAATPAPAGEHKQ